jgi:RNA polymerase sigma-70 factor, ECF subfamily
MISTAILVTARFVRAPFSSILWVTVAFREQFESVLAAAKTGAEWAIVALYREWHPSLVRYLRAQAPAEGEDLASEVWLDVAAALGRFDGDEAAFRRWLFTIAHRRLIDHRRREVRRRAAQGPLEAWAPLDAVGDPEAHALAASETDAAVALIASLPADQAEVVLLRVLGGLDVADVAALVGKKPGTVRVLQHRALTRLAEELQYEREKPVTQ